MSTDSPAFGTDTASDQLREAKSLHFRHRHQYIRFKQDVAELTTYNAPKLALEDFRPTVQAAEVLLNAYTSNSYLLQDLMEVIKDPDLEVTVKTMKADLMDLKNINREICRMTTVRNAYMEALTIQRKTNRLTESDILPGSTEQSDLDALRV